MSLKERWGQAGLVAFRLPSGYIVSGVAPSYSDIIRRGLIPAGLRAAVSKIDPQKLLRDLDDGEHATLVESRLHQAAAFVRGMYDDETGEWERVTVTFDEITSDAYPPDDIAALEQFVMLAGGGNYMHDRAAELVNTTSELVLGLLDIEPEAEPEEAGDTVDAWADFRDEPRGVALREDGAGLEQESGDRLPADPKPAGRPSRRRRAVPAPGNGAAEEQAAPPG